MIEPDSTYFSTMANFQQLLLIHFYGFLQIESRRYVSAMRPHWRIYYNLGAGHGLCFKNRIYELDADHLCLIPPHTAVEQTINQPVESLFIHASLGMPYDGFRGQLLYLEAPPALRAQATAMIRDFQDTTPHDTPLRRLQLAAFIYAVLAQVPPTIWPQLPDDARIRRALLHLHDHATRRPDNHELARIAGLSVNRFCQRFRQQMQISPQAYLLQHCLDLAAQRLLTTPLSIDDILSELGFYDRSAFSKQFRRHYGHSPAAFRSHGML